MTSNKLTIAKVGWLLATIAAVWMTFTVTACGKKDGGGSKATTNRNRSTNRACSNCGNTSDLLASGLGNTSDQAQIQMALDFYADSGYNNNYNNNPYNNGYNDYYGGGYGSQYYGSVSAEGRMFVDNGNLNGCSIPSGDYVVTTVGSGQWSSSGIPNNIVLEASGPGVVVRMRLVYASLIQASPQLLSCAGEVYSSEMWGQFDIETISDSGGSYSCPYASIYLNNIHGSCF